MIDFKEIAPSNKGGKEQDTFELFSRDFLEVIGFKIIQHPYRGADGGKDMIVSETRTGNVGETTIKYLVSCKHYAHSNDSIGDKIENNILDRVQKHKCDGFIAVYSTIAAPTVSDSLLELGIENEIYDHKRIEKHLLETKKGETIVSRYFPNSYVNYKSLASEEKKEKQVNSQSTSMQSNHTEQDLINASKTAIIIIEVEKIRERFLNHNLKENRDILNELSKYSRHSNEYIAHDVLHFLDEILAVAGGTLTEDIASSIFGLVTEFYPTSYDEGDADDNINLGKLCIYIGSNMAYNATIKAKPKNLMVLSWALTILKHVYKYAKQKQLESLMEMVLKEYTSLDSHLDRPHQDDCKELQKIQEFVTVFEKDLETPDLSFPIVPESYYNQ